MEFLDVEEYDEKRLRCCCPYHREDTASFIYNPKTYSCHCFGCGLNVDFIDAYMKGQNQTFTEAIQKLFELADIPYSFGEHHVKTKRQYRYPKPPQEEEKDEVYAYLGKRHISPATADYLDIRQETSCNGSVNMTFMYYDLNDVLLTVKYRPARKVVKGENKNICQVGADTTPILYNMNRVNPTQPLLICCGELDCASAIEAGFSNAVSIPFGDSNFHFIEECWDFLEQFKEIIICPDNDESGMKFVKEMTPRLGTWRCKIAQCPETVELKNGDMMRVKDLNETLYHFGKEKVLEVIFNAQDSPIPSVIDFSDIKGRDISEMEGVKTGFAELDRALYKIHYGSLLICSGYPGAGKTSFLYSIICNAIDQGVKSFLFSRELPEWMSKSWLNHILAGPRNHEKFESKTGEVYYRVPYNVDQIISENVRSMLYIYKDDYPNDVESLISSMTDSARKYGVRFFVVDNLVTVDLGGGSEDQNERQTKFVSALIQFATKYQVAVVLVCHPNKQSDVSQNVGMYQISGTSNIINLGHRAIGLRKVTDREKEGYMNGRKEVPPAKHDVAISIIKDRFNGAQGEYHMYYDKVSRRFYSNQEEYDRQYSWDTKQYTKPLLSERLLESDDSEVFGERVRA